MGIIAAGQITVVDLSDAPVLNAFITASRPTTQTYSKDSKNYNPSYASTPQVLTLNVTKSGSTTSIIDSISGLHWFVVDGPVKTEITSKVNTSNEYISGKYNEILTTKLNIDTNKGYRHYEATGVWHDPSTDLDVQFSANINLLLTQNGATGPQGPQGATGNGIANTVVTYGLSMSDTTEPATWSSDRPALVKGMYLWIRTVIIYTNGKSTTSYQISYIPKDADATAEIDKTKQELLEKLETVRDDSLEAVEEAKQQLVTVRDESLAAAEEAKQDLAAVNTKVDSAKAELTQAKQDLAEVASDLHTAKQDLANSVTAVNNKVDSAKAEVTQAKQQLTTVSDDLSKAKTDFQNAVSAVDTKATNVRNDLSKAKQDLASQTQKLQEQANAQSELTKRVSSVEETANGTKTTVSELSKTVAQNGKDITSVTARTKVVEDDLAGTKTTLSQVKTTADSTSQKTATLESGLNGLSAKFENLSVGTTNHFLDSAFETTIKKIGIFQNGNVYTPSIDTTEKYDGYNTLKIVCEDSTGVDNPKITYPALAKLKTVQQGKLPDVVTISFWGKTDTNGMGLYTRLGFTGYENSQNVTLATDWKRYIVHVKTSSTATNEWLFKLSKAGTVWIAKPQFEFSTIASDYHSAEEDTSSKIAEYKQNADQNYASLQTTVQNLDGTVQHNKTVADQTAQGFTTRIESLETYKDGESTRANHYFELAKTETARQLSVERTAISKDYVAKSTYTSDVTGIRNELSATTTTANTIKTNLANYQATNDKVVASLKSSLQTTDGKVSNLQTKVEAVPGQITSAVSSVESKIPTNVSTRNLILKSNDFANPHKQNGANTEVTSTNEYFVVKSTGYTANTWGGMSWNMSISEVKAGEEFSILMPVYIDSSVSLDGGFSFVIKNHSSNSTAYSYDIPTNKKNQWFNVAITFKAYKDVTFDSYPFFICLVKNGLVRIKPPMLVRGNLIPSDYQPAFEDTVSDIKTVSSQIKQTADGMTLLATKTELSTAKNELQSGINTATNKANNAQAKADSNAQTITTHTTQISALNTGLQAKVSQTDFNTLSGRVTTAENNITAKANELSSKITSVEGKIPTNVSTRNLILKSNDFANPHKQNGANTEVTSTDGYFVIRSTSYTSNAWGGISWNMSISEIKAGEEFSILMPVYIDSSVSMDNGWAFTLKNHPSNLSAYEYYIPTNKKDQWFNVAITFKSVRDVKFDTYPFYVYLVKNGLVRIKPPMLVRGNLIPSDYQPAFEDTESDIKTVSSQIKQTADGMTLLATKTELSAAKNELQSGINTATNKANTAQSTANNNAQTISTHTTQISALNTGLSAKVSQSDFNTLSGRVTTAENNITAKANELSSKITSVEGKIPSGEMNLVEYGRPANGYSPYAGAEYTTHGFYYNSAFKMYIIRNTTTSEKLFWMNRFKVERNTEYTLYFKGFNNGNITSMDVWFLKRVNGSKNDFDSAQILVGGRKLSVSRAEDVSVTFNTGNYDEGFLRFDNNGTSTSGASADLYFGDVSVKKGKSNNGWSPSLAELASSQDLKSAQSEIKQTKDGITLLATKTELSTAKNELQSGINTATNKANNNAQIINTHTTQISALNTGLQAKVSQTEFNTLSGRVTSAENNITAKANELSSKITSVEGKIPTNVSTRNLILKSNDFANPHKQNGANTTVTSTNEYFVVKSTGYTANAWGGMSWNMSVSEVKAGEEFSILMPVYIDSSVNLDSGFNFELKRHSPNTSAYSYNIPTNKKDQWFNVAITFKIDRDVTFADYPFYVYLVKNGLVRIKPPMLVRGKLIPSDHQPAPEDAISQITSLSSELKQTQNGITLLATKTELSTAKNELQSGINTATNKANNAQNTANSAQSTANSAQNKANSNAQTINTHTTQISALNTGLQAKVSQSEFNTLSGRVTTAENNITAKANELSSKITSIEGKIPTNVSTRNLILKSNDFANPHKQNGANTTVTSTNEYFVIKSAGYTANTWGGMSCNMSVSEMKAGEEFSILMPVYIDSSVSLDGGFSFIIKNHTLNSTAYDYAIPTNKKDQWFNVAITFKAYKNVTFDSYPFFICLVKNGLVRIKPPMLVRGKLIPSDYQPAPEDAISQISALSSELKQTQNGITLLATKTELNTAKNELQSGINTATNKANNAQTTANNNAQTIRTHTTQISALNTGLSAKVSQSDFNTLSGRVTTAENNITAKANELSSKITSVEGKIPTSVSQRNVVQGTSDRWTSFVNINTNRNWLYDLATVHYGDKTGIYAGTTINIFVYLSADEIKLSGSNASIIIQGMIINKSGTETWTNWDKYHPFHNKWSSNIVSGNNYRVVKLSAKVTNDSYSNINGFKIGIRIDGVQSGKFHYRALMVTTGDVFPDYWQPAPEDAINQISSLSSEFKQTTDSIKASVSSLDKSTVKNSSLTINADGIVMKAGKSTTDVANAIGSYFAVNQNAINLFSDKINVKGSMIVNGTITGDKIKASSVDVSKIVGIDANFIKSKIEYAMIDWLKGKTITAYNDNMVIDLQNGRISFKDGDNAVYRQTPDGIHTGFVHFEAGPQGGIQAAFGATSMRQGINSKTSAFAGIRCYRVSAHGDSHEAKIDKIELIGDVVQFGHGYASEGNIGGGFIMDNAIYRDDKPYSLNRMVRSIESLWRILHDHARNVGYNLSDHHFISALNDEYNAWHDMHNQ